MIRSFRSKPLKQFAGSGRPPRGDGPTRRLPVQNFERLRRLLILLHDAELPEELHVPGYGFHSLHGKPKRYALKASANWRLTFGWDGEDAIEVDLEDYH